MAFHDDDLRFLADHGLPPLPPADIEDRVDNAGASTWFAVWGQGPAVILLHGGLGNAGNWAYQVPALAAAGYTVIAIDSRGHGRSTCDEQAFSYRLMASDVRSVMERVGVERAAVVGWSDGADTGLVLAEETPERVAGLLFFACNVDSSGPLPFIMTPVIERIFERHKRDYASLSETPENFDEFCEAVGLMQRTQPEYATDTLARIRTPTHVVIGENDEFISQAHMAYLASTLPNAKLSILPEVSHFAPLQRPDIFNAAVTAFLTDILPTKP